MHWVINSDKCVTLSYQRERTECEICTPHHHHNFSVNLKTITEQCLVFVCFWDRLYYLTQTWIHNLESIMQPRSILSSQAFYLSAGIIGIHYHRAHRTFFLSLQSKLLAIIESNEILQILNINKHPFPWFMFKWSSMKSSWPTGKGRRKLQTHFHMGRN